MVVAALTSMSISSTASEPVLLHAAGSLRAALTEVVKTFAADTGLQVQPKFGASGLLKDEILSGAPAGVFASANLEHPKALAQAKRAGPVVLFARNKLCALVRPDLVVDPATLLDRMLDSNVKLGTSTPRADPSGDYAWEVFRKADALRPGASRRPCNSPAVLALRRRQPGVRSMASSWRADQPTFSLPIARMPLPPGAMIADCKWLLYPK